MDLLRLAVELTRQAMGDKVETAPEPQQPTDLGTALAQQFALIDKNMDAVVRMLNAQNQKLERDLRRQRIWNYALLAGIALAVVVALFR